MNRKLNLTASTVSRILGAVNKSLGEKEKKAVTSHKAKVYILYDGESLESWYIDLEMKGEQPNEKTEPA